MGLCLVAEPSPPRTPLQVLNEPNVVAGDAFDVPPIGPIGARTSVDENPQRIRSPSMDGVAEGALVTLPGEDGGIARHESAHGFQVFQDDSRRQGVFGAVAYERAHDLDIALLRKRVQTRGRERRLAIRTGAIRIRTPFEQRRHRGRVIVARRAE